MSGILWIRFNVFPALLRAGVSWPTGHTDRMQRHSKLAAAT